MLRSADRSEATMTIKRVTAQHFRAYEVVATNDVGRRRAVVELVRRRGQGSRRPSKFPGDRRQSDGRVERPTPHQDVPSALSGHSSNEHTSNGQYISARRSSNQNINVVTSMT